MTSCLRGVVAVAEDGDVYVVARDELEVGQNLVVIWTFVHSHHSSHLYKQNKSIDRQETNKLRIHSTKHLSVWMAHAGQKLAGGFTMLQFHSQRFRVILVALANTDGSYTCAPLSYLYLE